MKFAPKKYELIHFSRCRRFNLRAGIRLEGETKTPSPDICILGIWVDTKLQWSAHLREAKKKAASQIGALVRTTASTWGASFLRARQVYSAAIRPALAYGAVVWHTPAKETNLGPRGLANKLQTIQNKCLRIVAGVYKATPTQSLEVETYTPLLDLYLDSRLAAFRERLSSSGIGSLIQQACSTIRNRIQTRRRRTPPPVPEKDKWKERRDNHFGTLSEKKRVLEAWHQRWRNKEELKSQNQRQWDHIKRPPNPRILSLHKNLHKAESSTLIQLRTGYIGLRHFLNKANVPGYESGTCACGRGPETLHHVLIHCPKEAECRSILRGAQGQERGLDFRGLLNTPNTTPLTTKWMIKSGRIPQFKLAGALLYE